MAGPCTGIRPLSWVGNPHAQELTLSQSRTQRGDVQRIQPVAADAVEQDVYLFAAERLQLTACACWRVDERADVTLHLALLQRPAKGDPQDGVHIARAGVAERAALALQPCQHAADVLWLQLRQRYGEVRNGVYQRRREGWARGLRG